jgi:hypothetical protein
MAPLPETQKNGIRTGFINQNLNLSCGRCITNGHLMRNCPTPLNRSWQYSSNRAEAQIIYQDLLRQANSGSTGPTQPPQQPINRLNKGFGGLSMGPNIPRSAPNQRIHTPVNSMRPGTGAGAGRDPVVTPAPQRQHCD